MIDPERPVEEPEEFLGQQNVLRRIFSRIGADRPQSVAVIGGCKSGKTSLLNCVAHPATRSRFLGSSQSYLFCRIDSADRPFQDSAAFVAGVRRLLGAGQPATGNPYNALQEAVERLHGQGRRLLLLLDDFHLITSNKSFPLEFFSFLRSLANNYNLAYLTTSFLELQKLCVIKDIEESPFFNIFTNLSLGPLSAQEGLELLAGVTGRAREELAGVVDWSGCFPYVLKLVGRRLDGSSGSLPADPERDLLPVLAPYFERILAILPPEALGPLKSVAREKAPDPREAHVLRPLIKQGFLREQGGSVCAFSPAFAAFLRRDLSRKLLQGNG